MNGYRTREGLVEESSKEAVHVPCRQRRCQSAMEYLMTYGWAILIIAVVLGALFGLGFFNSANLAPKVSAGSCQVQRPYGPATTSYVNLEGVCNNELPQYVASFNGNDFVAAQVTYGTMLAVNGYKAYTILAWIYPESTVGASIYTEGTPGVNLGFASGNPVAINTCLPFGSDSAFWTGYFPTGSALSNYNWALVAVTASISGTDAVYTLSTYQNGILSSESATGTISGVGCYYPSGTDNYFGIGGNPDSYFGGSQGDSGFVGLISNVQVYNSTLSANEIAAMYQEGIGGVPINLNSLAGWWPLNGNANDYSGNLNNGVPVNVVFTSSWTNGYSAP